MEVDDNNDQLCPSYRCEEGSRLLGVRQSDGLIAILANPLEMSPLQIDQLNERNNLPEQQFRFVNNCQQNHCKQWTKKGCGIALRIVHYMQDIAIQDALRPCSIRENCRWHKQEGDKICSMCPYIITDITAEEIDDYFKALKMPIF